MNKTGATEKDSLLARAVLDGTDLAEDLKEQLGFGEIVYKAVIPLTPITKKNSQEIRVNKKTGARWIAPSKQYESYAYGAGFFLKSQPCINYPVNVRMIFYMPNKRRVDVSNL